MARVEIKQFELCSPSEHLLDRVEMAIDLDDMVASGSEATLGHGSENISLAQVNRLSSDDHVDALGHVVSPIHTITTTNTTITRQVGAENAPRDEPPFVASRRGFIREGVTKGDRHRGGRQRR